MSRQVFCWRIYVGLDREAIVSVPASSMEEAREKIARGMQGNDTVHTEEMQAIIADKVNESFPSAIYTDSNKPIVHYVETM